MRAIPACGISLIKSYERDVLRVYDDKRPELILTPGATVEGTLTAGYGHTGPDVVIGMEVTQKIADDWFASDSLDKVISPIFRKIGAIVDALTDNQYGALCDFTYNLGVGSSNKPEWTIWKRLRAKQFDQIPQEFAKFVNWNGQKSLGLVRRRAAEQILWSTDEPGSVSETPSSATTQTTPTPPTAADPVPIIKSPTIITLATGAVASVPTAVDHVVKAIGPYADKSDTVEKMVSTLSLIGAIAVVAGLILAWAMKRRARQ